MHQNFILRNMDYVYFIYGIAFIWLALLLHPLLRVPALASKLRLRWLISFAVCHGLNEWLDMFALVVDPNPLLATIRLSALSLSFLFLLEFCRLTWGDVKGRTLGRWIYLLLIPLATQAAPLGWAGMNAMARYLLGLPGGVGTAYLLWRQTSMDRIAARRPLAVAVAAVFCYSLAAGLLVPQAPFFPANMLNNTTFLQVCHLPVQMVRTALILIAALALSEVFSQSLRHNKERGESRRGILLLHWSMVVMIAMLTGSFFLTDFGGRFGRHFDIMSSYVTMDHVRSELNGVMNEARTLGTSLAMAADVGNRLQAPSSQPDNVDSLLNKMAAMLPEGSTVVLLDLRGTAIAVSGRYRADSLWGKSFASEGYFQEALQGKEALSLSTEAYSHKPSITFSQLIKEAAGKPQGVAVVTVALSELDVFLQTDLPTFLVSPEGIVLQSSEKESIGRVFWPMDSANPDAQPHTANKPEPVLATRTMSGEMAQYSGRNVVLMQGQLQIPGWTLVQLHQDRAEPWFRLAIIVCCILGCLLVQGYFYTLWQESERRRAIEISAARYRAMFENNLAPMLMVDTNSFDVMGCNAAACRFYGFEQGAFAGLKLFDLTATSPEQLRENLQAILSKEGLRLETMHRLMSGELRDVEVYLSPVLLPGQTLVYSIIHDISERKRAESEKDAIRKQLIHTEKLASIGTLAAGVAHEINNPLTIIRGFNARLAKKLRSLTPDDNDEKMLDIIDKATSRIVTIVESLGAYARSDNDLILAIDLHQVVQDVIVFITQLSKSAGVQIDTEFEAQPLFVRGNVGKLQQVLVNLMGNACDALASRPSGRRIVLQSAASGDGNTVTLVVSDNGSGIPTQIINKIFDPFFTTKPVGKGTGLGLAISQSIISSFGGSLQVFSREGEGTSFHISLLRMAAKPALCRDVPPVKIDATSIRLRGKALVVDDESGLCTLLQDHLEEAGLTTTATTDAHEALALMKNQSFDLIVTDMHMPAMTGLTLIRQARTLPLQHATKYLIMTGAISTDANASERAEMETIVDALMIKPWDQDELITTIAGLLSTGHRRQAA